MITINITNIFMALKCFFLNIKDKNISQFDWNNMNYTSSFNLIFVNFSIHLEGKIIDRLILTYIFCQS